MSFRQVTRIAVMAAGLALATAPAFAWVSTPTTPTTVPEPSTLALMGIAIPGAAAWIKRKLG